MLKLTAGRSDGGAGTGGTFWEVEEEDGGSGGRLDWTNGEEDGMGIEGRIELRWMAGRMVPGPDWNPPFILFSISSMLIGTIGKDESYHCESFGFSQSFLMSEESVDHWVVVAARMVGGV
ncbi:hypothetical protein Bca52824_058867 [Brassica carinata]|uniref:Uncharacterized protein n=1 Tax=Brassica carinata TaxID=52824 RepID=A0A8X7QUT2_BRACI|nr:hypothetical protein Bca52824_058867 [Brassica carinata]